MRVAFAGTPEFALPALEALLGAHDVAGVLTQPDRPSGRGRALAASPVKRLAVARGLALLQPATLRDPAVLAALAAWQPEALVVVAYGLMLPSAVLTLPRLGCINIHASLLPRWRGAAPVQRAILAGDMLTGVTLMQMDAGLDTGPVLLTREWPIGAGDTGGSLLAALATLGAATLLEALAGLARAALTARPQSSEGITYAAKILKAEAPLDWTHDAMSLERQVRAFLPWPVAETTLDGERLRIHAAAVFPDESPAIVHLKSQENELSGTIVGLHDGFLLVRCGGGGYLGLQRVQKAGGRVIEVAELAHNLKLAGRRLG
ncbi:MAG TPA: methionyl-tRNA formyltransferase [Steroidobacteraceae bacterium]|nr:methionyl-tRNA formyltransferase [Steroidobacteraceae bacterium]